MSPIYSKGLVAITGANGFLGRHVTQYLLDAGYEVRCLVRDGADLRGVPVDQVEIVHYELNDPVLLKRALQNASIVVHLASIHNRRQRDREHVLKVNVQGTVNVLQALESVDAFVLGSSIRSLMSQQTSLIHEGVTYDYGPWDSNYGISKMQSEKLCLQWFQERGLPLYLVNPAALIGPDDVKPSLNGAMIQRHLQSFVAFLPESTFPFADVRDAAKAILHILNHGQKGERHIVCAANWSLQKFFNSINQISQRHPRFIPLPHQLLTGMGFCFEMIEWILPNFEPPLVRATARAAKANIQVSGKKLQAMGFDYRDPDITLQETVHWFLTQHV
ncbi:MAG: NAD-dependent epimerase/dehydratase family protein [Magnetococcus sp. DMHC-6]